MNNIIDDVATLTTCDKKNLEKLAKIIDYCISDYVHEAMLKNEEVVEIDMGIGYLAIKVADGVIKYRFTPNEYLEKALVDTIKSKENQLSIALSQSLNDKLAKVYKELL